MRDFLRSITPKAYLSQLVARGRGLMSHSYYHVYCLHGVCAFLLVTKKNECTLAPRESLQIREMIKTRSRKEACMQSVSS